MEVFVFFSSTDELALLQTTLQAWEAIQWADPVNVLLAPAHQFEIKRRAIADGMAKEDHYILADVGCVPESERAIPEALTKLSAKDGLIGFSYGKDEDTVPTGVRIIGKGLVKAWPKQITPTYDKEHAEAIRATGKNVATWPIHFKRLQAC